MAKVSAPPVPSRLSAPLVPSILAISASTLNVVLATPAGEGGFHFEIGRFRDVYTCGYRTFYLICIGFERDGLRCRRARADAPSRRSASSPGNSALGGGDAGGEAGLQQVAAG